MFPFDLEIERLETEAEDEAIYKEYEIDYKTGQLTGRIVEGKEAVKTWVYLALHTERYIFPQYSWNYGNELNTLIGSANDEKYLELEAKRLIEDCLLQNRHITGVENVQVDIKENILNISMTVNTDYGEAKINVRGQDL